MATVALLAGQSASSGVVARALRSRYGAVEVIVEGAESPGFYFRRRARRLGRPIVAGQVLFVLYGKVAARRQAARLREILNKAGLPTLFGYLATGLRCRALTEGRSSPPWGRDA
jgi:hypothetical protein